MLDDTNDLLQDGGAVEMPEMNLEGKLSPSERLRKNRERLEERNKLMVEKKIEDVRIKQEIALTKKLQESFEKGLNNMGEDKVQVAQAAPVAPAPVAPTVIERIIEVPAPAPLKVQKDSKVIAGLGATAIKGDNIDFESKMNVNVSAENHVLPHVSIGIAVGYTTLDITDTANSFINNGYSYNYNTSYNNSFGTNGRAISYDRLNVETNGKFFLTVDSKVKPFVGAAIGYNRTSMKYNDSGNNYTYANNTVAGNEGYSSGYVSGTAKLGAEVDFSDNIGLNLDLSYTKAITSGIAKQADATNQNPDQLRLANITNAMEKSDVTAVQVGLVVRF
jgi:hypothetical protein